MTRRPDLKSLRWRVGRKVGRTVYAEIGDHQSDDDILIGVMDTPSLAQEVAYSHNKTHGLTLRTEDLKR